MKRVFHDYRNWEEYKEGMWRIVSDPAERARLLKAVVQFMSDPDYYGAYMNGVVNQWKVSCEHNLTCEGMNRRAWIGQAACCLMLGCPEDITREGWAKLTQEEQNLANEKADIAIAKWEKNYKGANSCQKSIQALMF